MDAFITLQKKIAAQPLTGEDRPRHLNADSPGAFDVPEYGAHDLEPPKNPRLWNIITSASPKDQCTVDANEHGND
jgi:NADH-quinone oxidoreductase subunit B